MNNLLFVTILPLFVPVAHRQEDFFTIEAFFFGLLFLIGIEYIYFCKKKPAGFGVLISGIRSSGKLSSSSLIVTALE